MKGEQTPRPKKKPMGLKNALKVTQLARFFQKVPTEALFELDQGLRRYFYYWLGKPTEDAIEEIRDFFPLLEHVIDFDTVIQRLEVIDTFERGPLGIKLSEFFPELAAMADAASQIIDQIPRSTRKAEYWLRPIARSAGADADVEAAIYFASRGNYDVVTTDDLREAWYGAVCHDIEWGKPVGKVPEAVLARAKSRTISLAEASSILTFNGWLPRFFKYRDEEEDFIDAAMCRTVEWFSITGFEPWLDSFIEELSLGPQGGIEHGPAGWGMFHWCRSDLALRKADRHGLEAWLWALINGPLEREKPWRVFGAAQHGPRLRDYIPLAGIIPFVWHRVNPTDMKADLLGHATGLLYQTQMGSGAWPSYSDDDTPDLLTTCVAIHGLALHKPPGWEPVVARAARWVLDQQDPGGYWHVRGGPTVMLTVLALDAIELAEGRQRPTFHLGGGDPTGQNESGDEVAKEASKYNYHKEDWYNPALPNWTSVSLVQAHKGATPSLVLIVATETELRQTLRLFTPLPRRKRVWKVVNGHDTYYLGRFGAFDTVVTLCSPGSIGPSAATLTVNDAIKEWNPKAVILEGIAFGASREKHRPADVLIAEHVIPYEQQRVGSGKTIFRNPVPPSSTTLLNRFRHAIDWSFLRPDGSPCSRHIGPLLSGDKLVDNLEFKKSLLEQYPNAIGGEMEGAGFWSAADRARKHWIVVKAVCDWADGQKNDDYHQIAAAAAVSLCHHVFSDPHALDGV